MSPRKIIFLIVLGIVGILILFGLWKLSQSQKTKQITPKNLSVWVVGDTTEQYKDLFSEFGTTNPLYKNTNIEIRVFPDYEKYQRILLSTLSEGNGPDIFMIEGGGDALLESKALPIPSSIIDLSNFEKKYEDIFLPLLITEGEGKNMTRSLLGVPIGYETLGMFYHKSLLRSVPKTWSEVGTLSEDTDRPSIIPTNLGYGPTATPGATDIIAYFMGKDGKSRSTENLSGGSAGLAEYLSYADQPKRASGSDTSSDGSSDPLVSTDIRDEMSRSGLSTVDLFMRGRIAILIGFPSLVSEIEKSEKRAGADALGDLILTEKLPQDSLGKERVNIARYRYLALSKKTENPTAAADLLSYLMSDRGAEKALESFPLLISPLRALSENQRETSLSEVFARTRLDAFIPGLQDDIFTFNYGLKSEYENFFREYIDRDAKIDINNLTKVLKKNIDCELESTLSGVVSEDCVNTSN